MHTLARVPHLSIQKARMGKKGERADRLAARKALGSRFDAIVAQLQEELRGIDLFAPPPPSDVCAICLLPLSRLEWNFVYKPCCGNSICNGCDAESAHAAPSGSWRRPTTPSRPR